MRADHTKVKVGQIVFISQSGSPEEGCGCKIIIYLQRNMGENWKGHGNYIKTEGPTLKPMFFLYKVDVLSVFQL